MAKKLKSLIYEQLGDLPQLFLARALEARIEEFGIKKDVSKIAKCLAVHLMSGDQNPFVWDGESKDSKELILDLSNDEIEDIIADIRNFIKSDLPGIVVDIGKDLAKSEIRRAKKEWPEYYIWERGQFQVFKDKIELRWGNGLTLLRMLLNESRQIGERKSEALRRSKAKKNLKKREVLLRLHMRSIQTTSEIVTLIESGFPDGAMARWRTLYEIRIVAGLVEKFGDEIAIRYIDYQHVSRKEEMENHIRHFTSERDYDEINEVKHIIESNFQEVIRRYGSSFSTPYGWAAHHLQKKRPNFRDLEASVGLPELPPTYKMASYRIHAGVAGLVDGLGILGSKIPQISGASNAGLEVPAIHTAYTLLQITGIFFEGAHHLEDQVYLQAIANLRDEIEVAFNKAAQKLYRDEMKVR